MAPWWKRHHHQTEGCARCQGHDTVREGLCRKCRADLFADQTSGQAVTEIQIPVPPMPGSPSLEPSHDRPWVHRGGG
jgi:hypothetical protein